MTPQGCLFEAEHLIKKIQYIVHSIINYRLVGTHSVVRTDLRLSHKLHPVPPSLESDFVFSRKECNNVENRMKWNGSVYTRESLFPSNWYMHV